MFNVLKDIETKYPVSEILVNGRQAWPYLRIHYYSQYARQVARLLGEREAYDLSPFSNKLRALKTSLRGLPRWFRRYDYIALSSASYRRPVNGRHCDRFLDPIIDELGGRNALLIETPTPIHFPAEHTHTTNVVSSIPLNLVAWLLGKPLRSRVRIGNFALLKAIQRDYGLQVDDRAIAARFAAQYIVFKFVFRMMRPKVLLLTCYYGGREAAVRAAKDVGVTVVEVQHGVIGKEHPAYNLRTDIDRSCFPDDLLIFGDSERDTFKNGRFLDPANIHPVGSFYIEYMKSTFKSNPAMVARLAGYRRTVGVTLQLAAEKRLADFIRQAALLDATIGYVLIPRVADDYLSSMTFPDNVIIISNHNFYELMMYVDFHATLYSTCALEAPSLGVQNILIDTDNMARTYYGGVLTDRMVTRYVNTPAEFVETAHFFERMDRRTVCSLNAAIFAVNYKDNVKDYVTKHLRPPVPSANAREYVASP